MCLLFSFHFRFNRRRSPLQFRGNNRNNRGRMNHWNRRSNSRDRGGGGRAMMGGNRFNRNSSPPRRFSPRDRRSSPMQNQFRKFSPQRRFSPPRRSRDRRPNSRERRPSSPLRVSSSERGGGRGPAVSNPNRWDQQQRSAGSKQPKQRSRSASSNWEDHSDNEAMRKNINNRRSSEDRKSSPPVRGRKNRSPSRSQERYKREANRSRESGGKLQEFFKVFFCVKLDGMF